MTDKPDGNYVITPDLAQRIANTLRDRANGVEGTKLTKDVLLVAAAISDAFAASERSNSAMMAKLTEMQAELKFSNDLVQQIGNGFELINGALANMRHHEPIQHEDDKAEG